MTPLTQITACYDNLPQVISCTTGVIQNLIVSYGRSDTGVCCYGNTVSQHGTGVCASTSCYYNATSFNSLICNSQSSCLLNAPTGVDPCVGIYKYLVATWDCFQQGNFEFLYISRKS